jgi:hypothetical protein
LCKLRFFSPFCKSERPQNDLFLRQCKVISLVRFNETRTSNPTVREKGGRFCGSINKLNADKSFYQF